MTKEATPQCANDWAILTIIVGHLSPRHRRKEYERLLERANLHQRGMTSYEMRTVLRRCGIECEVTHINGGDPLGWAADKLKEGHTPVLRMKDPEEGHGPYWVLVRPLLGGGIGLVALGTSEGMAERLNTPTPALDSVAILLEADLGASAEDCASLLGLASFDKRWLEDIAMADWSVLTLALGVCGKADALREVQHTVREGRTPLRELEAAALYGMLQRGGLRVSQFQIDPAVVADAAEQELEKGRTPVVQIADPHDSRLRIWALMLKDGSGSSGLMVPNLTGSLHDRLFSDAPSYTGTMLLIHSRARMTAEEVLETFHP